MHTRRFDLITFALMLGGALIGLLWANYNRALADTLTSVEEALRPQVWTIFAIPFGLCLGWIAARRREGWLALFVCFCVYFFSTFVAARYESCTVVTGSFDLMSCFTATSEAQELARGNGHAIYFASITTIQFVAALVIALQRALSRSTMPGQALPSPKPEARSQKPEAGI